MKIDLKRAGLRKTGSGLHAMKLRCQPVIPLQRSSHKDVATEDQIVHTLRSVPTDKRSSEYKLTGVVFGTGTPDELLTWHTTLKKVINGQNVTEPANMFALAKRTLKGDALAAFCEAELTEPTDEGELKHFQACVKKLKGHVFPRHSVRRQRRYMRMHCRKLAELKTHIWIARLIELQNQLVEFPDYAAAYKLSDEDILEIAENGIPNTWHNYLELLGWNPETGNVTSFIETCERIKATEENRGILPFSGTSEDVTTRVVTEANKKRGRVTSERKPPPNGKWCMFHKTDSHDTRDCHTLKRLKAERSEKFNPKKNKTWTRAGHGASDKNQKSQKSDGKYYSEKELHALIAEGVKQRIGKSASGQKRKSVPDSKDHFAIDAAKAVKKEGSDSEHEWDDPWEEVPEDTLSRDIKELGLDAASDSE